MSLLLTVGCADPMATGVQPTPSRVAVAATPAPSSAETTPAPSSTETATTTLPSADNPLQQSLEALQRVRSFRWTITQQFGSSEPSTLEGVTTLRQAADAQALPDERTSVTYNAAEGIAEELFCDTVEQRAVCWSRVGTHPWSERISAANQSFSFVATMEHELATTTIISTSVATDADQLVVAWRMKPVVVGASSQQVVEGTTWLDQATHLPVRDERVFLDGEQRFGSSETEYRDYDAVVTLTPPIVATVTPAPTVFVPPQTTEAPRVEEPTFPGTLVLPPNVERAPAVILLHGSEGGAGGLLRIAREWTQRGFIALALCYYGCEGTPTTLNDVPVETVGRAVEYLRGRDDVDPDAIGVVGYSRGAEFALIAGVLDDRIGAVASIMGSYLVVPGYPNGGIAWTYEGKPLPWEVIPVERINGPVLVVHGERDDVWPVANSYHLADRLARHDRPYELVVYPSAGHSFNLSADATERAIAFMQQAFGR